jgi:hypothetical protein
MAISRVGIVDLSPLLRIFLEVGGFVETELVRLLEIFEETDLLFSVDR